MGAEMVMMWKPEQLVEMKEQGYISCYLLGEDKNAESVMLHGNLL